MDVVFTSMNTHWETVDSFHCPNAKLRWWNNLCCGIAKKKKKHTYGHTHIHNVQNQGLSFHLTSFHVVLC